MTPVVRTAILPRNPASLPHRIAGAAILAAALILAGCTTARILQPVTPIAVDANEAARLISAFRAENGLGPVHLDPKLMREAQAYAVTMGQNDKISHTIGGSLARRVTAVGYDWDFAAENLAANYPTLAAAIQGWKDSPGHRQNMLNSYAEDIGIAAVAMPASAKRRNYWALVLARPAPQRVAAGGFISGLMR